MDVKEISGDWIWVILSQPKFVSSWCSGFYLYFDVVCEVGTFRDVKSLQRSFYKQSANFSDLFLLLAKTRPHVKRLQSFANEKVNKNKVRLPFCLALEAELQIQSRSDGANDCPSDQNKGRDLKPQLIVLTPRKEFKMNSVSTNLTIFAFSERFANFSR